MDKMKKRRPAPEWLPQAHGAWAMLFLPFLVGVSWHQGPPPPYVWALLPAWILGYFAHNALVMWLRMPKDNPRRMRILRPLMVYGIWTAVFAMLVFRLNPSSIAWLPLFLPFLAVNLFQASRGDDVSLVARGSAVLAACMIFVVVAFPAPVVLPTDGHVALGSLALYFLGSLFYVKTMIRERGRREAFALSLSWHLACVLAAIFIAVSAHKTPLLPIFFAAAFARAALMPTAERRFGFKPLPKHVGMLEFFYVLALLGILWGRPS